MIPLGHIDIFTADLLVGWAWDPEQPDQPVDVAVMDGAEPVLTFRADRFRPDLAEAGFGNGRHAFELKALHSQVPWSRRNLTVVRAHDGAALSPRRHSMIATGSAHLYLPRGGGAPCVAFGDALYLLASCSPFAELAAWLPVTLPEPDDDVLPVKGQARLVAGHPEPQLVFESIDDEPFSIRIDGAALAGPHVRLCRGRTCGGGWMRNFLVLEVENVIGLQLRCTLPKQSGLGPKILHLLEPRGSEQRFELPRGDIVPVTLRVASRERHRITLSTEPEPEHISGFLLCELDAITRDSDLIAT